MVGQTDNPGSCDCDVRGVPEKGMGGPHGVGPVSQSAFLSTVVVPGWRKRRGSGQKGDTWRVSSDGITFLSRTRGDTRRGQLRRWV